MTAFLISCLIQIALSEVHHSGIQGGIHYDLSTGAAAYRFVPFAEGGFQYESPRLELISSRGTLFVNGESAGALIPGDSLELKSDGSVLVNGEERFRLEPIRSARAE